MKRHPIISLLSRRRLCVLGVNSGTSIDGLDGAVVEIIAGERNSKYRIIRTMSRVFPKPLQRALSSMASAEHISKHKAISAHFELGEFIAQSARHWMREPGHIDLIASHGQTIAHYPDSSPRATWQIGALSTIAQRTGRVTVGDFRPADITAGGMGAPLSGYYHHLLFGLGVPVLNIGGIANVSVSYKENGRLRIIAFDTGPGNMIVDALAQRFLRRSYDREGAMAARGEVLPSVLTRLMRHSYFKRRPPKSCGREEFGWDKIGREFGRRAKPADLLATATELTARSITLAVARWIAPRARKRTLLVTGGGASNRTLIRRLGFLLPDWKLASTDDWGIPPRYVEPAGFAVLAYETPMDAPAISATRPALGHPQSSE